jgi:hypothetical protein
LGDVGVVILKRFSKRTVFVLLLCFVALVGAVGAYAYLVSNHPSVELSRRDVSNGLVLEIDKTIYEREENVTITLTNNSTETVGLASPIPFVIRDQEGNAVAPGAVIGRYVYLPPGESLTFVWDQYNHRSLPHHLVPPGIYTVELYTSGVADLSVNFKIV